MPRMVLPPTPCSSTDIKGQDGLKHLASLQMAFELPPPAMTGHDASQVTPTDTKLSPTDPSELTPPKTPYPMQASETVKSRRRQSSAVQPPKDQFALPPPPTRSRKIIQMKPRAQEENLAPATGAKSAATSKQPAASSNTPAAPAATAGTKRKQPSATSAAGRKIARKTAHSLIERRRRSKMNEEFAVLKSMIPACTGEMHKLAILQASIEYVRYLEDCVAKLKAHRDAEPGSEHGDYSMPTRPDHEHYHQEPQFQACAPDRSPDVDMTGSEAPSPTFTPSNSRSQQPSISPALLPEDSRLRHNSQSSASTDRCHCSYSASASTSPAFGPQVYHYPQSVHSASGSTLTSPALAPQRDIDHEATAALLMLNQTDRRGTNGSASGRGMSVRELLTT